MPRRMRSRPPGLLFLLLGAGLVLPRPLAAAVDRWTPTGPDVASVPSLAVGPTGEVYAGTAEFGVFRSTDRGARWSAMRGASSFSYVQELALDPGDPRTVYALRRFSGLFRSRDGGPWVYVGPGGSPSSADAFAVAPSDPNRLYLLNGPILYVSRDRGATWVTLLDYVPGVQVADSNTLHVDPRDPDVVLVGSDFNGVIRSTDGGLTWQFGQGEGGTRGPVLVVALALDPRDPDVQYTGSQGEGIWKSTDGGRVWRQVLAFPGFGDVPVALAVDPAQSRRVYAAVLRAVPSSPHDLPPRGEIWRSKDGGATWGRLLTTAAPILALAIDPTDPRVVYAGLDHLGVLKSADRGATWRAARRGLKAYTVLDVAADPLQPGTLWLAAPARGSYRYAFLGSDYSWPGIFRSRDGGRSWAAADRGIVDQAIELVVPDPALAGRVWAYGEGRFFRSLDGGASWQGIGGPDLEALALAVDPSDPDRVYTAGSRHTLIDDSAFHDPVVARSLDGGETWSDVGDFAPGRVTFARDGRVNGLLIHPLRPASVFAGATTGFFRSRNAGERWVQLGDGLPGVCGRQDTVALDPFARNTFYALACHTTRLVFKSTDSGAHWAPTGLTHDGTIVSLDVLLADPRRRGAVYAAGSKGLFATGDGGASWRRFESGLPKELLGAPWIMSLAADPRVPGRLYAGLRGGGLFTMLRSD